MPFLGLSPNMIPAIPRAHQRCPRKLVERTIHYNFTDLLMWQRCCFGMVHDWYDSISIQSFILGLWLTYTSNLRWFNGSCVLCQQHLGTGRWQVFTCGACVTLSVIQILGIFIFQKKLAANVESRKVADLWAETQKSFQKRSSHFGILIFSA